MTWSRLLACRLPGFLSNKEVSLDASGGPFAANFLRSPWEKCVGCVSLSCLSCVVSWTLPPLSLSGPTFLPVLNPYLECLVDNDLVPSWPGTHSPPVGPRMEHLTPCWNEVSLLCKRQRGQVGGSWGLKSDASKRSLILAKFMKVFEIKAAKNWECLRVEVKITNRIQDCIRKKLWAQSRVCSICQARVFPGLR